MIWWTNAWQQVIFPWIVVNPFMHQVNGEAKAGFGTCAYIIMMIGIRAVFIAALAKRRGDNPLPALWREKDKFTRPIIAGLVTALAAALLWKCANGPVWALIPAGMIALILPYTYIRSIRMAPKCCMYLRAVELVTGSLVAVIMLLAAVWYCLQDTVGSSPIMPVLYWMADGIMSVVLVLAAYCLVRRARQGIRVLNQWHEQPLTVNHHPVRARIGNH